MEDGWKTRKILITVRTYPTPARKGVEVSCTAGITDNGRWIRLFPVPWRLLSNDKRFRKYQWIKVSTKKASDPRPESYQLDPDTIEIVSEPLSTTNNWQLRKDIIYPLKAHCLCCLQDQRDANQFPTLGIIKPKSISGFKIEKSDPTWSQAQMESLKQTSFFENQPLKELEKIPYTFKYSFKCQEPGCTGHELMCTDWEIMASYRMWVRKYGKDWERILIFTLELYTNIQMLGLL